MNVLHSCVLSAVSVKSKPKEMRVLSCDEYKKLTAYFICESNAGSVGMLIALLTGLRIGELCALKYNDVDIPNMRISINKTMQRLKKEDGSGTYISIESPKSRASERVIPIPDFLCKIIQAQHYADDDYILTGTDKYIEPRTLQYRYKRIMEKLGIRGTTFHTLRHSFATRCVEVGFDIKSLSEILGHSNVNITLNRYVHSSFELKAENMKKLSVFLDYSPSNL
ncbi:MAG: site-specific integrase [Huintestinicola sp.]